MVLINDLSSDAAKNIAMRPSLEIIASDGNIGRARFSELYNMFYKNGPGNGTFLGLPFDQLVEHGPGHLLKWKRSADTRAVIELANKGPFSAIALSIGQAEKYGNLIRPDLPLIIKVDGHFLVGKEVSYDRHSTMSSVERAVRAGANAIGLTFYLGGRETEGDAERCSEIVDIAHQHGKPVFAWMYARGPLADAMGADSLFWCAYGISAGESIGADVIKQKFPVPVKKDKLDIYRANLSDKGYFTKGTPEVEQLLTLEPENPDNIEYELHVKRANFLAHVAPNSLKILSGGPTSKDIQGLLLVTKIAMDAGLEGEIVGRNNWGRPIEEGIELAKSKVDVMRQEKYSRILREPRFSGEY